MPQLMPLMWINSIMMGILIVITLINNYYYKEKLDLIDFKNIYMNKIYNMSW